MAFGTLSQLEDLCIQFTSSQLPSYNVCVHDILCSASQRTKVAIIGGGAAGLAALRHLSTRLDVLEPVAFEQTSNVGGTWCYTDNVGNDENGLPIHTSMYKNLRTNLPKEVMAFPDFPFDEKLPSYVGHADVRDYLEKYAAHYNVLKFIKFSHVVLNIQPLPVAKELRNNVHWGLTYKKLKTGQVMVDQFDAVMVCCGHFSKPLIPDTMNVSSFNGLVLHSHDYRTSQTFQDKIVVVVGAASSGIDIAIEISSFAKKIYLCHNNTPFLNSALPKSIVQKSGVQHLVSDGAFLVSGETIAADSIILCTGYHYAFPFLSADCKLEVTADNSITSLYKSLIHVHYPTMSFIGIPKQIVPFPLFDRQCQFIVAQLVGKVVLPEIKEMEEENRKAYEEYLATGKSPRHFHNLDQCLWPYVESLEAEAELVPLPPVVSRLFAHVKSIRPVDFAAYKNIDYKIVDENSFITVVKPLDELTHSSDSH